MAAVQYHIRDIHTGLWLVAPVSAWREKCKPEWVDHSDFAYRFTPVQAADQLRYLWWNTQVRAKRCRVNSPKPTTTPDAPPHL